MSYLIIQEKAFAKLLWFRKNCNENNVNETNYANSSFLEVSLMGVSAGEEGDDLITVEDFVCVPQECTSGNTEPTDDGMAIYFENMMFDRGIMPNRCGRIWAHTHPGQSPQPSGTDEDTYRKWFSQAEFAVMYILAEGNNYCKIKHTSKQLGAMNSVVEVYIMLDKLKANGDPEYISTGLFFEIEKLAVKMGESYNILSDYSDKHKEWITELKECVKKKSYGQTSVKTYQPPLGFANSSKKTEEKEKEDSKIIRVNEHKFTTSSLLNLLIKFKKNTLNEFTHKGIKEIADHYNISVSQVQNVYSSLTSMEKISEANLSELVMSYANELIVDGVNAIKHKKIGDAMLLQICDDITARPCVISEVIDDLLMKAGSSNG